MKKSITGTTVLFTFEGLDPLSFDAGKASAANRAYAEMHGWQARIGDMAAIPKQDAKGNVVKVTEEMRRAAVEAGIRFYEAGGTDWNMKGTRAPTFNPQIQKIAAAKGISYDEAQVWWADHEAAILAMA